MTSTVNLHVYIFIFVFTYTVLPLISDLSSSNCNYCILYYLMHHVYYGLSEIKNLIELNMEFRYV